MDGLQSFGRWVISYFKVCIQRPPTFYYSWWMGTMMIIILLLAVEEELALGWSWKKSRLVPMWRVLRESFCVSTSPSASSSYPSHLISLLLLLHFFWWGSPASSSSLCSLSPISPFSPASSLLLLLLVGWVVGFEYVLYSWISGLEFKSHPAVGEPRLQQNTCVCQVVLCFKNGHLS